MLTFIDDLLYCLEIGNIDRHMILSFFCNLHNEIFCMSPYLLEEREFLFASAEHLHL
jgi:hypothetical protein